MVLIYIKDKWYWKLKNAYCLFRYFDVNMEVYRNLKITKISNALNLIKILLSGLKIFYRLTKNTFFKYKGIHKETPSR